MNVTVKEGVFKKEIHNRGSVYIENSVTWNQSVSLLMAKRRSEYPPDGIFNLHFTPLHIHMRFARSSLVYGV